MKATIRECNKCEYRTFIMEDDLGERKCMKCNGLMKIIAGEKENE